MDEAIEFGGPPRLALFSRVLLAGRVLPLRQFEFVAPPILLTAAVTEGDVEGFFDTESTIIPSITVQFLPSSSRRTVEHGGIHRCSSRRSGTYLCSAQFSPCTLVWSFTQWNSHHQIEGSAQPLEFDRFRNTTPPEVHVSTQT